MVLGLLGLCSVTVSAEVFTVSFPAERSSKQLNGRVLLLLLNDPSDEPRMQISVSPSSQQVFGLTVDGLRPGEAVAFGSQTQNGSTRTS
jgi:hypothetical protein